MGAAFFCSDVALRVSAGGSNRGTPGINAGLRKKPTNRIAAPGIGLTLPRRPMRLSAGCTLGYQIAAPTAAFTFNVLANNDAQQRVVHEEITCLPPVPTEIVEHTKGGRVLRCEAPA